MKPGKHWAAWGELHYSTREKKRTRREWRKHADRMARAGCTERAAVWRRRGRNG